MPKSKTGKTISCYNCSKEFYVPLNRFETAKFCSQHCKGMFERQEVRAKCEVCGDEFTHISSRVNSAKYCSRSCYYKSMSLKGTSEYECKHCHKKFLSSPSKKRVYCSRECINKSSIAVFNPVYTTVRKSMVRRSMITSCQKCGYKDHPEILGVHHIDRNPKNNKKSNLAVLCPNCHSLEHRKHICHK